MAPSARELPLASERTEQSFACSAGIGAVACRCAVDVHVRARDSLVPSTGAFGDRQEITTEHLELNRKEPESPKKKSNSRWAGPGFGIGLKRENQRERENEELHLQISVCSPFPFQSQAFPGQVQRQVRNRKGNTCFPFYVCSLWWMHTQRSSPPGKRADTSSGGPGLEFVRSLVIPIHEMAIIPGRRTGDFDRLQPGGDLSRLVSFSLSGHLPAQQGAGIAVCHLLLVMVSRFFWPFSCLSLGTGGKGGSSFLASWSHTLSLSHGVHTPLLWILCWKNPSQWAKRAGKAGKQKKEGKKPKTGNSGLGLSAPAPLATEIRPHRGRP